MERTDSDQTDVAEESPKPVTWHSGWRLLVTLAVAVVAAKLLGFLGAFIAFLIFFWLQPKRGTGLAVVAATVAGLAVAVVSGAVLQSAIYGQQQASPVSRTTPATQPSEQIGLEKGVLTPPTAQSAQPKYLTDEEVGFPPKKP